MQQYLATTIAELRAVKKTNKQLQASVQSQLATVHALASNSSGGTGGGGGSRKSNEPIVCHKLMLNKAALSGEEDYDSCDHWFIDMADDFEILMPGAKRILQESKKSKERITLQGLLTRGDAAFATTISRELFSALKKKTIGQARAQLKPLTDMHGLEAWRFIRANLCRKDGQRLQGEFDTLTNLVPIKLAALEFFKLFTKDRDLS